MEEKEQCSGCAVLGWIHQPLHSNDMHSPIKGIKETNVLASYASCWQITADGVEEVAAATPRSK